jgi:hypothetical protein
MALRAVPLFAKENSRDVSEKCPYLEEGLSSREVIG